jgi:uncharacterized protein (DUF736 family)
MINIGALWKKKNAKGEVYLAGPFGDAVIMVFPNTKKTNPNQPDYRIVVAEKKNREEQQKPKPAPALKPVQDDDDIPF